MRRGADAVNTILQISNPASDRVSRSNHRLAFTKDLSESRWRESIVHMMKETHTWLIWARIWNKKTSKKQPTTYPHGSLDASLLAKPDRCLGERFKHDD